MDILSGGGRTELGLGAGAFWQAIKAFGGPVRAPREAVQALEEAIAIIRGMWTPALSVKVPGEYYAVRDDSTRHKCQWLLRYCTDAYSSICH